MPNEPPVENNLEYLTGSVARTIYRGSDDYTVFVLDTSEGSVTVVGSFPELQNGEELRVGGQWVDHPQYGRQFEADTFSKVLPDTEEGLVAYLSGGLIRGVGTKIAQRIVDAFGTDTLEVLEEAPERLLQIEGIAKKKKEQILNSFRESRHLQKTITHLQQYGLSLNLAMKLYREYKDEAPAVIEDNPYRLTEEVWGVGFKTADRIARAVGIKRNSPERLGAVMKFQLRRAADREGHVFVDSEALLAKAVELLEPAGEWEVDELTERLQGVLLMLVARGELIMEDDAVYLRRLHRAEQGAVEHLERLLQRGPHLRLPTQNLDRYITAVEADTGIELAREQRQAVHSALEEALSIITGGPGTGKTTIVQAVIGTLHELRDDAAVLLAAPTGRAAQRLTETTGVEAKTLHRLLEYTFNEGRGSFARDEHSPLEGDILIVDESSMIDSYLAYSLLRAVPDGMRVVFVGDADQLPPVGPGDFLRQLIESGVIPVTRLTRIFRQEEASDIIVHAHQINRGQRPRFEAASDVTFLRAETGEKVTEQVVDLVSRLLQPEHAGHSGETIFDWQDREVESDEATPYELQVIAPMRRGPCGVQRLNRKLQEVLNPPREGEEELARGSTRFRAGDRVMCLRNNYQKGESGIFNGNIGSIERVVPANDSEGQEAQLVIDFNGETVKYNRTELEELGLAYATTVHKAQGSEFPAVVLVVAMQHYIMLHRNLLYTGYTRASEKLYVVGSPRALHIAVKNARMRERNTGLAQKLREEAAVS